MTDPKLDDLDRRINAALAKHGITEADLVTRRRWRKRLDEIARAHAHVKRLNEAFDRIRAFAGRMPQ